MMSKTRVYHHMVDSDTKPVPRSSTIHLLLDLPAELFSKILELLEPSDILSLRRTNYALHDLVHNPESTVLKIMHQQLWKKHSLRNRFHAPRACTDLTTFFDHYRQHSAIHLVAKILAEHVVSSSTPSKQRPTPKEHSFWKDDMMERLTERLTPALIILQNFLGKLSEVFVQGERDFEELPNESYLSLRDVYDFDQQRIIEEMHVEPDDLSEVTAAWGVLCGVIKAQGLVLAKGSPYTGINLKVVLLILGLAPLRRVLDQQNMAAKIHAISIASKCLQTGEAYRAVGVSNKLPTINALGFRQEEKLYPDFSTRDPAVLNQFWMAQDIWKRAATAVLMRKTRKVPKPVDLDGWIEDVLSFSDGLPEIDIGDWRKRN